VWDQREQEEGDEIRVRVKREVSSLILTNLLLSTSSSFAESNRNVELLKDEDEGTEEIEEVGREMKQEWWKRVRKMMKMMERGVRELLNEVMGGEDLIEDFDEDEDDFVMSANTFEDLNLSTHETHQPIT